MKNFIAFLVVILLFGTFAYGVIQFFNILFDMDAKIIAAFFAAITAIVGGILTQFFIKKREQENAHRDKKIEIYNSFINMMSRVFIGDNNSTLKKPTEDELAEFMYKFKAEILLWGSPGVVKAMLEFQNISNSNEDVIVVVNKLYKEFRKDIGLSNFGLDKCELIKLGLTDPEELDKSGLINKC